MNEKNNKNKIGIIGGGASGLAAAIFASAGGASEVVIFEAKDAPGKKINGTGNGKCNFTNDDMDLSFYRGEHPEFVKFALESFDNEASKLFFRKIGITSKVKNGTYVYPYSEEASSVSAALRLAAEHMQVRFVFERVKSIEKEGKTYIINNQYFDKVIICCGSFANMKDVTDFNGYGLVKSLGHRVTPLYPALCQIRCADSFFKTINGVRTEAELKVLSDAHLTAVENGELLFTDYGLSGIPAFQLSRFCAEGRAKGKKVVAVINFLPKMTADEVKQEVEFRLSGLLKSGRTAEETMFGLLNHKLNYVLLKLSGIDPTGKGPVAKEKMERLVQNLTELHTEVTGTNDYSYAQVVAGGVDTCEVDPKTMESRLMPGVYFAGEILDVDGTCGGYNLQWAWSSGYVAGLSASGRAVPGDVKEILKESF